MDISRHNSQRETFIVVTTFLITLLLLALSADGDVGEPFSEGSEEWFASSHPVIWARRRLCRRWLFAVNIWRLALPFRIMEKQRNQKRGQLSSGGPEGNGEGLSLVAYWPNR